LRSNVVLSSTVSGSSVILNDTVVGGLFGSLLVSLAEVPVPTWWPYWSRTTKLHWIVSPPNGVVTLRFSGSEPTRPPTFIRPVVAFCASAPSICGCSVHELAVAGQPEASASS
jgi:hypothetical protein